MLKNAFHIICIIILSWTSAWCQSDEPKFYQWSFGVSAGDILHELFNGENTNESYAAFVLEYAGEKNAIQAGFRPAYNLENTEYEGFLDSEVTEQVSLSGDLAWTHTIFTDKNWLIRVGAKGDGGWSKEDITEDSGFDEIITRRLEWNFGIGPVIDFRLFVHPRISLGTEAGLLYTWTQSELQQLFTNFPDFNNTKEVVEGSELTVEEPATIYLRFHF